VEPLSAELPLWRHVLFESRDRDEAQLRVGQVFCPHELRVAHGDARLDARHHYVSLGRVSLSYLTYGAPVGIDPECLRTFYLVQVPLQGAARVRVNRTEVASSTAIASVINPSDTLRMEWSADCGQLIVRIESSFVDSLLANYLGPPRRELRFTPIFDCSRERNRRWLEFVRQIVGQIEAGPDVAPGPLLVRQLEQALLAMLLESQPNDASERLAAPRGRCAPRHVRKAEEFIVAHVGDAIGIEDIVAASGVSMRSLYDGFRRFRGTSPMEFLRTLRLGRVRADLLGARPGTRVSAVAARWGFFQFGRLAAQYRRHYGETPSATLQRALSSRD
jgi:AraC-like DNA-binding protein